MEINWQGKMIEVAQVDFLERKESWNEYQLTDGKILRIKLIATTIFRAKTELNQITIMQNRILYLESENKKLRSKNN